MATETDTGYGSGTGTTLGPGSSAISALRLTEQVVTNAYTAPSDTPSGNEMRILSDASGRVAEWYYSVALAAWKAVALA